VRTFSLKDSIMPAIATGPTHLDGVEFETWLLKFDKSGVCTSPQTRAALLQRLGAVPDTPIVLFSHGWNNEFGDATGLYAGFLAQLQAHSRQFAAGSLRPVFIGIIWPSTWLSFDTGPRMAAANVATATDLEDELKQELADTLPAPAMRARLYTLLDLPRLDVAASEELADLLAQALTAGQGDIAPDAEAIGAPDADALMAGTYALQTATSAVPAGDDLGDVGTVDGPATAPLQGAGALGFLDPRRALRVASVYVMKDRAGTVGWRGVSALIIDVLAASRAPLHLVGHSYGAKVVLSALVAARLPRPVSSALLLEPAISHLCFASQVPTHAGKGGYHDVLPKIEGSLLMTYSAHDVALHDLFHHALQRPDDVAELRVAGAATAAGPPPSVYAALGGYGPRGAGELLREPLPEPGTAIELPAAVVPVAFDGTLSRRIAGHGDVVTPYTAWLLYSQMASPGGGHGHAINH
jgi:hypothetical protein